MYCNKHAKKNAAFCGICGGAWEEYAEENWWTSWNWSGSGKDPAKDRGKNPNQPRSKSARERKKEAKEKKAKAKQNQPSDGAPNPFGKYANPGDASPWPVLDSPFAEALNAASAASSAAATSSAAVNQELLQALKQAYASPTDMPPAVKDLVERTEQDNSKQITKDLHAATTALGKAKKSLVEAHEARRLHRQKWMAHLVESLKSSELQLQDFRKVQAELQQTASVATKEVAAARKAILDLNSKAGTATGDVGTDDKEETDLAKQEAEEEALRSKLDTLLKTCVEATGVPSTNSSDDCQVMDVAPPGKKRMGPDGKSIETIPIKDDEDL